MQDLNGQLDTLRQEVRESRSREGCAQDNVHRLEQELSEKEREALDMRTSLQQMERRLVEQGRALDEARRTEQRKSEELREV